MTRLIPLLLVVACTPIEPLDLGPEETMRVLRASGEHPSDNELTVPEGSAFRAVNVVVDKPNAYAAHKGLQMSVSSGHPLSSFTYYRDVIIAHSQVDGKLLKYAAGAWTEYSGTYYAPGDEGVMSFDENAGSLFMTTTSGVFRLDGIGSVPTLSGLPQALPGTIALASGAGSALGDEEATAYRANWAINVDDGGASRLVEGAPSPRLVVANASGGSKDVEVTLPIPENLPDGAYVRLFRADVVPASISPLDEMRQVYERAPTPDELTAGEMVITDATPDTVKGSSSYWSANTGDGLVQSNYAAPLLQGLTHFAESGFGVGVSGVQRLTLTLVGIGPTSLQVGSIVRFLIPAVASEDYVADTSEALPDNFEVFTSGTPAQNIANTVSSLVRCINARPSGLLWAFPLDSDGTEPGKFIVTRRTLDQTPVDFTTLGAPNAFFPATQGEYVADTLTRVANVVTATSSTASLHGFAVGQEIRLTTGSGTFPSGTFTVMSIVDPTSFTYTQAGVDDTLIGLFDFFTTDPVINTDSGNSENAYVWSKRFEPDHFPLANINTVGGANDRLWWSLPLDRWNFLGSEAGLYRINGNADDGFSSPEEGAPWDSSTSFLGRRNVAYLDGQGYALSKRGVVTWGEGAKPVNIDGPIEKEIREAIATYPDAMARYGFMFADPTNHRLYFARPESADATAATLVHVWNAQTGAWTRLTNTFPGLEVGINDGMAPIPAAGVGYFLPIEGGPTDREGTILTTRNTATADDYQGPEEQGLECKVTYMPWTAGEPMRFKMWSRTAVYTKADTSRITFGYATDLLPTEETQTYPDVHPEWPFATPVSDPIQGLAWKSVIGNAPGNSYMRGRRMSVSVAHSEPGEEFQLYGVEVQHRSYGSGQ
jgi:hypothetical protein